MVAAKNKSGLFDFFEEHLNALIDLFSLAHANAAVATEQTAQSKLSASVTKAGQVIGKLFNLFQAVLGGVQPNQDAQLTAVRDEQRECVADAIGAVSSSTKRKEASCPISGVDLNGDIDKIVKDLSAFLNSEKVNEVSMQKICDPYAEPQDLDDGITLMPAILRPILQKEGGFDVLEAVPAVARALIFMRRGVLVWLRGRDHNQLVKLLNPFNQVSFEVLKARLAANPQLVAEKVTTLTQKLAEITKLLRVVAK